VIAGQKEDATKKDRSQMKKALYILQQTVASERNSPFLPSNCRSFSAMLIFFIFYFLIFKAINLSDNGRVLFLKPNITFHSVHASLFFGL
jgi:hypothetical protein